MRRGFSRRTIADLCHFINGNGFKPGEWKTSGLPIIRIQNLNGGTSFNYYDGPTKPDWLVEPGDLLYAWAGVKGVSFGPTLWSGSRGVLNQHIYKVVPRANVDPYWLYLVLKHVTGRIEAQAHGFKSSLVHVHKEDITGQAIEVPSPEEQQKIAVLVGAWDGAIEKTSRVLEIKSALYLRLAEALLVTPTLTLYSKNKRAARPLSQFTNELTKRNSANALGRDFVMGVSNAKGIVPMREQTIAKDLSRYKILPPKAFAYNPMRINVGSIAMSRRGSDVLVSPDYVLFECKEHVLSPDYFDHLCSTHWWNHYINESGSGSVRQRIYYDDLAALRVVIPPFNKQQRIANCLNEARREIELIEAQIAALGKQKRGLMQKLLTGEWKL